MIYDEWEEQHRGVSPEARSTEAAWNAAIEEAIRVLNATLDAEDSKVNYAILLEEELQTLNTCTGSTY